MAAGSEADIAKHISKLASIEIRAKFLKKCAQQLLDNFDGQVPQTREELERLAGVGPQDSQCGHECRLWDSSLCCRYPCGADLQAP